MAESKSLTDWIYISELNPKDLSQRLPGIKQEEFRGCKFNLYWSKVSEEGFKLISAGPGKNASSIHLKGKMIPHEQGTLITIPQPSMLNELIFGVLIAVVIVGLCSSLMWSTLMASSAIALPWFLIAGGVCVLVILVTLIRWRIDRSRTKVGLHKVFKSRPNT